jgi:hypothetical protein
MVFICWNCFELVSFASMSASSSEICWRASLSARCSSDEDDSDMSRTASFALRSAEMVSDACFACAW